MILRKIPFAVFSLLFSMTLFWVSPSHAKQKASAPISESYEQLVSVLFRGQHRKALELLGAFQAKKTKGVWKSRLDFLAAQLYLQAGDFSRAADLLEKLDSD